LQKLRDVRWLGQWDGVSRKQFDFWILKLGYAGPVCKQQVNIPRA
jgi:hypothetical protein